MGTVLQFDLVDRLRKHSRAHFAICKILKREIDGLYEDCAEEVTDCIFEELWLEGFKIVPRNDAGKSR